MGKSVISKVLHSIHKWKSKARKEYLITGAMLTLITYTLGLSLVSQALSAGQTSSTFSSTGAIQIQTTAGIGAYSDSQGNTPLTSVSWGTLSPGGSTNVICYIKNEGSSPTTLSLETSNWSPASATNYLALSWNYNGQPIAANAVVQITLMLSVASSIEGITNFGFDITIVGSC
jgi:hypothetical protein